MGTTMNANSLGSELRRSRRSMVRMQWGLVGLSGLLAVALLADGAVVIGGLIGVMAIVRTTMIVRGHRAREAFRRQLTAGQPRS